MDASGIEYRETRDIPLDEIIALYRACEWSSAKKSTALYAGLLASHALVTAWSGLHLVGLGNAISDGHLVVYFPHLLVHPEYQAQGIGSTLMRALMAKYHGFHQQALLADGRAIEFYRRMGFIRAGRTEPMWIFDGDEH
jgi:GNAT superfamily N-acetyltransferase